MPPVEGIANGALILSDKLFLNMNADRLNYRLRPKVDWSQNLDELFGDKLDYFVLFSSLATVADNAGQFNYHAATIFMAALAANRRARWLPAFVIHVGVVADAGSVTRQSHQLLEHLRKQFLCQPQNPTRISYSPSLFSPAHPTPSCPPTSAWAWSRF
ncbi:polyketide synthase-nonribosomal peptide synthetase [Colletotrichum tofieldiae]|nr:Polyketide synthase-nonribosomal peptide synthetase [Colletotrichum tofieldiae]GKT68923.1 polyketide synthase-nonribosomal peptide synthetase [Colletotrichum tofieldiae]GKT96782.1 polyketide synthase-nonribosomal peptide synthetase [Colletotrichum tofieldiae]